MAGSGDPRDNPVAINVVPMIDVIFCLCVFFMCSFRFQEQPGKFETWLPKDKGVKPRPLTPQDLIAEIRITLAWDAVSELTLRRLGARRVDDDAELRRLLAEAFADNLRLGKPDVPAILDVGTAVPWQHVVTVINLVRSAGIERIEFAMGALFLDGKR